MGCFPALGTLTFGTALAAVPFTFPCYSFVDALRLLHRHALLFVPFGSAGMERHADVLSHDLWRELVELLVDRCHLVLPREDRGRHLVDGILGQRAGGD